MSTTKPDDMNESLVQSKQPPPQKKNPWEWYKEKPLQRWPFLLFLLFGVLAIIWIIMFAAGSKSTGFILAGVCAIIMSAFGAYHFKILLGLKEEVDKMAKLNREFKAENAALQQEVNKLSKAREELGGVEQRLKDANLKLKTNLEKFRKLDENLKNLSDSNIEGLQKLRESSAAMMEKWHESLVKHEKAILGKLYDQFGWSDGDADMNKEEFEQFLAALPESYRVRFNKMGKTFDDLSHGDGKIDLDEFTSIMDSFAEAEASKGGSQ